MEKKEVKGIPYGVASFEEVRSKDRYYVDKTMYLPLLEEANDYLFLIRPRRSRTVSILSLTDYG